MQDNKAHEFAEFPKGNNDGLKKRTKIQSNILSGAVAFTVESINIGSPMGVPMEKTSPDGQVYVILIVKINKAGVKYNRDFEIVDAKGNNGRVVGFAGYAFDPAEKSYYQFYDTDRIATAMGAKATIAFLIDQDYQRPLTLKFGSEKTEVRVLSFSKWKKEVTSMKE